MKLRILNTLSFATMVAVNYLANTIPLGGNTTGEISRLYPNLLTPAPITFAIWGLIYLMMFVFIIYQWDVFDDGNISKTVREKIGLLFSASCLFNILWIICWHSRNIGLSVISILLLLVSLIFIEIRCNDLRIPFMDYTFSKAGFDLYFGWIIVACIVNIGAFLSIYIHLENVILSQIITSVVLLAGAGIISINVYRYRRFMSGVAAVWAYVGILIRYISIEHSLRDYPIIAITTFVGILVIVESEMISTKIKYTPRHQGA